MKPEESFLNQPIRSLQTMLRVIMAQEQNEKLLIPDGIYGPETTGAVSRFQQNHGLAATGITDQETWDSVVDHYDQTLTEMQEPQALHCQMNPGQCLKPGDAHCLMYIAQAILCSLAEIYSCITPPQVNGTLDDATSDALASFQQLSGLPMSGQLDKTTWKHLALQYPLAEALQNHAGE